MNLRDAISRFKAFYAVSESALDDFSYAIVKSHLALAILILWTLACVAFGWWVAK